ncbi:hypothetical protein QLY38_16305 [Cronobacter sakazakii]|nr:hypothetical protein [Cronobacter sakazakii]MDI7263733.1 hypothetical protein [Cronobacter sakazakii]MDI7281853.1 hypothetical protein [Cronobacter sakazakii]MDI7285127.1 hypothetical protein [Cronobacter sakazakii]MDI7289725.1 hypothetical protein [Cronobacter sakazakii]MDI7298491.1 hypothetical protein [Cronobacter sakazakii]
MATAIQLPLELMKHNHAEKDNVVELARLENWERLNQTIVSTDTEGNPVVTFGDSVWDIRHYFSQSKVDKHTFSFLEFRDSSELTIELKLIVYGWLFHKSSVRSKPAKPSSLIDRFSKLKKIYRHLQKNNHRSLIKLTSNKVEWNEFEKSLIQGDLSQRYLDGMFVALNHVLSLQEWLKIDFQLAKLQSVTLGRKLSNKVSQQTLSIPERIADEIYGTAIELVENAYCYRKELALAEKLIQQNYLEAKSIVDSKIQTGVWNWLTDISGEIADYHRYAQEIYKLMPHSAECIIAKNIKNTTILSQIKKHTFKHYYSILISASYICCGAFSGMRHSELGEITSSSYFMENFDGRSFHMLQSKTFKMGEKSTTWVAAPIAKKAIELASELTKEWRLERANASSKLATDVIWLSRFHRSKIPSFANWTFKLKNFCKQFNINVNPSDFKECVESNPNSSLKIREVVQVGKPWPLAPHQFRRSLAFYTIKHRLGTTISLKQQYKHLYLQMTEWYTEGGTLARLKDLTIDNKLQEILYTTKHEEMTNKIFNFVHSDKPLSGSHGKAIVAMRGNVPHMYSSWDIIYQSVKNGNLSLHGTLHSYCKNGYNCDMDGVINPAFCVDCSSGSSIIDEENAKWWQTKHRELTAYLAVNTSVSISIYSHCITQIRAAELVMRDFGMSFVEYKHQVEVTES